MKSYLDFDLTIEPLESGYRARVINSPAGQGSTDFTVPFTEQEIENLVLRVGRPRRGTRRIGSPELNAVKHFGKRLFETVFGGEVRACFEGSLIESDRQGTDVGLRIRLRLAGVPELANLPWEFIYSAAKNQFFALSRYTPIVRHLDLPERVRPLAVDPPLCILVMVSSPSDYDPLDVELEWQKLKEALQDLEQKKLVVLERLPEATLLCLQRHLRKRIDYHIFHFIGHGGFEQNADEGVLVLEGKDRRPHTVKGQTLGTLLHDKRSLRLAVLNACEGARNSLADPFAGTAQTLVQHGIPAVIAMQFEITDQAAITFAHEFYLALTEGLAIESALAEARLTILSQDYGVEWGTPVLYMRAIDGHIFDVMNTGAQHCQDRDTDDEHQDDTLTRMEAEQKQRDKEEHARLEAEQRQREQAEHARLEAEQKQRLEAERARLEAEQKQREESERIRLESERKQREETERKRLELEQKQREEEERKRLAAEQKQIEEAERAKLEAERRERAEVERKRLEIEQRQREEKERARLEAERKEREEAERAKLEAEREQREEEERARLKAEQKKREEEERARLEAEQKRRQEIERARLEAERKMREEADRRQQEWEEEQARKDAECKMREEADRQQQEWEEAQARLREKLTRREETERIRREEAAEKTRREDERKRQEAAKKEVRTIRYWLLALASIFVLNIALRGCESAPTKKRSSGAASRPEMMHAAARSSALTATSIIQNDSPSKNCIGRGWG